MEEDPFDFDSACSTPYVSAPSSPGRSSAAGNYFYSAPASPMHFFLSSSAAAKPSPATSSAANSVEFEFTVGSMSSADELFLNGQIRPMKLSSHLQRPQTLAPLLDLHDPESMREKDEHVPLASRGRDLISRSDRRRSRSLSPLRNSTTWHRIKNDNSEKCEINEEKNKDDDAAQEVEEEEMIIGTASMSASSSRSSSGGRSSKRWILLKEFLYRSKSEGRNNNTNNNNNNNNNNINISNNSNKFWNNFTFSPAKAKKVEVVPIKAKKAAPTNGVGKRRGPASAHEMHYKAKRAQAEEMRKKTFLPYRQGLIGCLGFSSKGYGAVSGLARALNPTVSSR